MDTDMDTKGNELSEQAATCTMMNNTLGTISGKEGKIGGVSGDDDDGLDTSILIDLWGFGNGQG
jgi:hypothetical protein